MNILLFIIWKIVTSQTHERKGEKFNQPTPKQGGKSREVSICRALVMAELTILEEESPPAVGFLLGVFPVIIGGD